MRGTAVGAAEGGIKGAATGQGTEGAIEGAIAGGTGGAAAEALPAVVGGVHAVKNVIAPSEDVAQQVTKDAIKKVLGSKADADVVADAASRLEPQGILSKHLSNVENELKLVKPKVDAELLANNAELR